MMLLVVYCLFKSVVHARPPRWKPVETALKDDGSYDVFVSLSTTEQNSKYAFAGSATGLPGERLGRRRARERSFFPGHAEAEQGQQLVVERTAAIEKHETGGAEFPQGDDLFDGLVRL